jgi:hypothetical protein
MKLKFSRLMEQYANIIFHEACPLEAEFFPADRRTDKRHGEAND